MKGVFVAFESLNKYSGISKKILNQVKGLEKTGHDISLITIPIDNDGNKVGYKIEGGNNISKFYKDFFSQKLSWRTNFSKILDFILKNDTKYIYIRYLHFANPFFIGFLKRLQEGGVYILLEIPTYPYDLEYKNSNLFTKINLLVERKSRAKFIKYVDSIVTFSNEKSIFGVPTVRVSNGVNIEEIKLKKKKTKSNSIDLIAVASIAFWHGFDRLIEGMREYYGNGVIEDTVILHIVGDSSNVESRKYKELVAKYNLEEYVKFYGLRVGAELDTLFDKSDFAIGCLGVHRKGITNIQSIKNREYSARGIPFMYSEIDKDFEEEDFIIKVPPNDSSIDINLIIDFIKNRKISPEKIREYTINNLTWDIQMKKVIDVINIS